MKFQNMPNKNQKLRFLLCMCVINKEMFIFLRIQHDRIDDMSIRVQSNSEENWTKALKNVLINLNILLAWLSSHP